MRSPSLVKPVAGHPENNHKCIIFPDFSSYDDRLDILVPPRPNDFICSFMCQIFFVKFQQILIIHFITVPRTTNEEQPMLTFQEYRFLRIPERRREHTNFFQDFLWHFPIFYRSYTHTHTHIYTYTHARTHIHVNINIVNVHELVSVRQCQETTFKSVFINWAFLVCVASFSK